MSIPNRQIGWSTESNLLWQVAKQIQRLSGIIANSGGGGSINLQEVTTAGNETTEEIVVRDGDWTLNLRKDPGLSPLLTMTHDVYGEKGIYTSQGLLLNSVDELAVNCQMEILAERTNYIGFKVQNEDIVNVGNNLFTTLTFPTTSSINQPTIARDFVFPDKPDGFTYTLATTSDLQTVTTASNYLNDAAAAAGGIAVGGLYHTAGVVKIRLV
jgi:hypothetical protein